MVRSAYFAAAVAGAMLAGMGGAHAAFVVTNPSGVGGNAGTYNVIANGCTGNATGPASSVQGCLNDDRNIFVNFASTTDLLTYSGGQATVKASDDIIDQLTISAYNKVSLAALTFSKLILNIDWELTPGGRNADDPEGAVSFTANPNSGNGPFTFELGNGNNWFVVEGEDFSSVSFTFTGNGRIEGIEVQQVRLGGIRTPNDDNGGGGGPTPVPEPATLGLLGMGLLGLAAAARRRRKA